MDLIAQPHGRSLQNEYGYLFEYLLVTTPSNEVYKQMVEEKQYFFDRYGEGVSIKTKPYITIANFLAKKAMEETIIRWMNRAIGTLPRFSVLLNNYGGFPPHTIYVRVQQQQPFKQLANALQSINHYVCSNDCPPMHLVSKPQLIIARKLSLSVFERAIMDYSQKTFSGSFEMKELVLLRRQHQFDACKKLTSFQLSSTENVLFNC